jgi:hypothetical protein
LSPHLRRSFNNIFVAVNPVKASDVPITFIPPPSFPGPTDGNLYHRFGAATADAFRTVPYTFKCVDFRAPSFATLDVFRASPMFEQSETQYPPGYEASGLLTDPHFRLINADGEPQPLDDLRLQPDSPARSAGVPLPPTSETGRCPGDACRTSRDIGCYLFGSQPLQVGVNGRRRFPIIGTIPTGEGCGLHGEIPLVSRRRATGRRSDTRSMKTSFAACRRMPHPPDFLAVSSVAEIGASF